MRSNTLEGITIYNTEVHKAERQQICEDRIKERAVVALRQIESHLKNLKVTGLSQVCTTLEQLVMECSSLTMVENIGQLDAIAVVPPNEKLKVQFRPKKMVCTSKKRNASSALLGPSPKNQK